PARVPQLRRPPVPRRQPCGHRRQLGRRPVYELRVTNGTPSVFQQGTYAPDSSYRWMGSIAMDHVGDIALGYSVSSSTLRPGIRYTGRLAGDPLGAMTQ